MTGSMSRCVSLMLACLMLVVGSVPLPTMAAAPVKAPVGYIPLPQRPIVRPRIDCAALAKQDFAEVADAPTRVLSAAVEPATAERAEFCLVKGYIAPAIQFELRLPTQTYTGRYLQGGCGGACGMVWTRIFPTCDEHVAFNGSFAVGFNNSGHVGNDGVWALGGDQVREDFAQRSGHAFSQASKAIIKAYYGEPPAYAYFQGCSGGGREAMMLSQRFPKDFNGIVAGSPAHIIGRAMFNYIWQVRWLQRDDGSLVYDRPALETLHAAAIKQCDGADGLIDGQIDDPRLCRFDPATIQCRRTSASGKPCLSAEQVEAARRVYDGAVGVEGRKLHPGGQPYGSELQWVVLPGNGQASFDESLRKMIYRGTLPSSVTLRSFPLNAATFRELTERSAMFEADNPDLRAFRDAGGKLLIWYGTADPAVHSYGVPDYYQRVQDVIGGLGETQKFARLFEVPATYHCADGYIPYEQDFLGVMVNWVEKGDEPSRVVASARLADGTVRSRPIFAFPARAKYKGRGDINDADSFEAFQPKPANYLYDWMGRDRSSATGAR